MRGKSVAVPLLSIAALVGCGGNSKDGTGTGAGTSPGTGTAYSFAPPVLNSTQNYSETIVDNSNNTINIGFSITVTALNSDGTFSDLLQSSTGSTAIVNGTNYAGPTENRSFNNMGQELSYTAENGASITCTFEPHGLGPDYPLKVGKTWQLSYTLSCGSAAPITYTQTGTVVDVESVTVPAGTYSAIKLQSTLTWTDSQGASRTQTITNWRDVFTSLSVKQEIAIAVSGTLPATGYAVSREIVLASTS